MANFHNNEHMFLISFFISCYIMRWSVGLLGGDVIIGSFESLFVFGVGVAALPIAAWTGLHLILN